jgi:hypothetical protein
MAIVALNASIIDSASYQQKTKGGINMLSLDCHGCPQMRLCQVRFKLVQKGEFVYCEDGTRHLVDG